MKVRTCISLKRTNRLTAVKIIIFQKCNIPLFFLSEIVFSIYINVTILVNLSHFWSQNVSVILVRKFATLSVTSA